MAEQSLLAKLGARVGIVGSSAALAIAAPLAAGNYSPSCHTDAARIGWYFDRTAGAEKIGIVVGGVTGAVYTRSGTSVNLTFNNPSPTVTLGDGTGGPNIYINGAVGTNRFVTFLSNNLLRWESGVTSTAESGGNAGSNWTLNAYGDAGVSAPLGSPMVIERAALGAVNLNRPVTIAGGTLTGSQVILNCSATWNNGATVFTAFDLNITDTASAAGSIIANFRQGATVRMTIAKTGAILNQSIDDLTAAQYQVTRTGTTITGNLTDVTQISVSAQIDGAFTVTRYNYLTVNNLAGTSTVTDGCVMRFNANAGTHKALASGTTKTTPGTVDAWMKININGTIYYKPLYTSRTT